MGKGGGRLVRVRAGQGLAGSECQTKPKHHQRPVLSCPNQPGRCGKARCRLEWSMHARMPRIYTSASACTPSKSPPTSIMEKVRSPKQRGSLFSAPFTLPGKPARIHVVPEMKCAPRRARQREERRRRTYVDMLNCTQTSFLFFLSFCFSFCSESKYAMRGEI